MDYHEMSSRNDLDYKKSGITLAVILMVVYVLMYMKGRNIYLIPCGAAIVAFLSLIKAKLIYRIIDLLVKSGNVINKFTNPIVIGLIYIIAVIPVAFLLKIINKDILNLKRSEKSGSYWIKIIDVRSRETSFKEQF